MSGKSVERMRGPVRQPSMMDIVKLRAGSGIGSGTSNRSASIPNGPAMHQNGVISKFLQRRTTSNNLHQRAQPLRRDYWKKLRHEENAKKLKMLKLKNKIKIAVRLSMFLRSWWHKHLKSVENMVLSDEKMDFFTKLIKPQVKEEKPSDALFDPSEYKANKHRRIPQEARRILTILPQYRSDSEVHYVRIALRSHKEIANCPMRMQNLIAKYGMLETFGEKRCILKEGHPPQAFYYIFYGTVAVAVNDGAEQRVVCLLGKGESFGELSIVENAMRQSSVISKSEIELVAIKKEVYEDAFMAGGSKRITDPDHEEFIRSLQFLEGWPTRLLEISSEQFVFTYFQRGVVLVKNSNLSEWLYVIKSGSVDVLIKLVKSKPTVNEKTGRQNHVPRLEREKLEAFICGEYFQYCTDHNISLPEPVTLDPPPESNQSLQLTYFPRGRRRRSLSAPSLRPADQSKAAGLRMTSASSKSTSKLMWWKSFRKVHSRQSLAKVIKKHVKVSEEDSSEEDSEDDMFCDINDEFCPPSEEVHSASREKRTYVDDLTQGTRKRVHLLTPADLNPQFVKVQTLTKGSTFGLADIVLGDQPNMCLVSNGAECIMIKKDFYMEHCPQSLLRKLLQIVGPYPEEELLQNDLTIKLNWEAQKRAVLNNAVNDIQQRLSRVGPQ